MTDPEEQTEEEIILDPTQPPERIFISTGQTGVIIRIKPFEQYIQIVDGTGDTEKMHRNIMFHQLRADRIHKDMIERYPTDVMTELVRARLDSRKDVT
jgi:hypothetical protein